MARDLYRSHDPRLRKPRAKNWPVFWALVALLAIVPFAWWYLDPTPSRDGSEPVAFVVREGEGWTEVTERLRQRGLIRRPLVFKAIVQLSGARSGLLPGRYQLRRGTSSRDLIGALTDKENQSSLTVPEGWRTEQIGERLVAQGLATSEQWRMALRTPPDSPVVASRPENVGLEGYIHPGTYVFTEENVAAQLITDGIRNLEKQLTPELLTKIEAQGLSAHDALTVASIVERETSLPAERPIVASVYLNRLRRGMKLQADPTTQYAVGRPGNWWKAELTREDLRNPSPYNTYVHEGLPPGPIASPGTASIEAVAQPARTRYLFFVAKGDGGHAFAVTYEEHQANVRRYLGR